MSRYFTQFCLASIQLNHRGVAKDTIDVGWDFPFLKAGIREQFHGSLCVGALRRVILLRTPIYGRSVCNELLILQGVYKCLNLKLHRCHFLQSTHCSSSF